MCTALMPPFRPAAGAATPARFTCPSLTAFLAVCALMLPGYPARAQAAHLPTVAHKQAPEVHTFGDCGPDGHTTGQHVDGDENHLKNRVDVAPHYTAVAFTAITELKDRPGLKGVPRRDWKPQVRTAVEAKEGIPVVVEGFLAQAPGANHALHGARPEGREATNCGFTSPDLVDWHIWLVPAAGAKRGQAVVVEITPRVRAKHDTWLLSKLDQLARDHVPVRVSGWTLYDPEHPEQLGSTRATLWEIHPVTDIEVHRGTAWVPLASWHAPGHANP